MQTDTPLTPDRLAQRFHQACRRTEERQIGLEVERIGFYADGTPLLYRSGKNPGAGDLLPLLAERYGWKLVRSADGLPIGMSGTRGKVSLEPGSQLELSANPAPDLVTLADIIDGFEREVCDATCREWGLRWIAAAVNPLYPVDAIDVIPSPRYRIMTEYLGRKGRLGTSMMRLTSSVQINLDYTSEAEAIEMLRAALAAAPVSYALFANSPFAGGKPAGTFSFRQEIWRHTDRDRTGLLPEAFADGFDFQAYARLAWSRPLMFAQKSDLSYVPAEGASLADIAQGRLEEVALTEANLTNAVQELFFEARLKPGYVEVRSIDGQSPRDRYGAAAFWMGLLYGEGRRVTLERLGNLSFAGREALFLAAGREGLDAKVNGQPLSTIAREMLDAARSALRARGRGEEKYLESVEQILAENRNPAQRQLAEFAARGNPTDAASLIEISGEG